MKYSVRFGYPLNPAHGSLSSRSAVFTAAKRNSKRPLRLICTAVLAQALPQDEDVTGCDSTFVPCPYSSIMRQLKWKNSKLLDAVIGMFLFLNEIQ